MRDPNYIDCDNSNICKQRICRDPETEKQLCKKCWEAEELWRPYKVGDYEKEIYDIRTEHRDFIECWPNAGAFHWMGGDGRHIVEAKVKYYRPTIKNLFNQK